MRREDDPVVEPFDQRTKFSEREPLAVAARETEDQLTQTRLVGGDAGLSDIGPDALGTLDEALERHVLDELRERLGRQLVAIDQPGQLERRAQDRVAERIGLGAGPVVVHQGAQLPVQGGGIELRIARKRDHLGREVGLSGCGRGL